MDGDEISQEWLYQNAVIVNKCNDWYESVMDPKTNDCFYELPIAATVDEFKQVPDDDESFPRLRYPQHDVGACGIAALSSAFHFTYSQTLSFLIHERKKDYMHSLGTSIGKKKKSSAMKFLSQIIYSKPLKEYAVQRMRQMVEWKSFLHNPYYDSIILCIPKSTGFSRDHIIGITKGWIFDGNLSYAIPLNEKNLTWCTSHGRENEFFTGFWEQIAIVKRGKNLAKKG